MSEDSSASLVWIVQVYDTQDQSLQVQGFRSKEGALKCVKDVVDQLDEQGGYTYTKPDGVKYSMDAECEENGRKLSLDVFECYVND